MLESLMLLVGLVGGGFAAFWIVSGYEKHRYTSRIRELESRMRYSQGQATELKDQFIAVQKEVTVVRRNLEEERRSKTESIERLSHSFKRGIMFLGSFALMGGLVFGGGVSWWFATLHADSKVVERVHYLQLKEKLSELKTEWFESQVKALENQILDLRKNLLEQNIARTVSETKLRIFLESLTHQRGVKGFVVDYEKLQRNLKKELPIQKQNLTLPTVEVAKTI